MKFYLLLDSMYSVSANYRKLLVFFLLFCPVFSGGLIAQTIRGRVLDAATDETIIGASIVLHGSQPRAAASGLDGSFSIANVTIFPAKITVSFLGYILQEIVVENSMPIVIRLEEDVAMIGEVVVTATNSGRTDYSARMIERSAMNVMNVVSARAIELSPDMTVADVIQRMSGVTMERNSSGEGQYALLRGMDKRFNYTLVNGIKIPSPDNKNRFVPLDIFPSELLDRLEVTKALTADMEGDGIGGAVNMIMKDAPERVQVNANMSTGFNVQFFSRHYQTFDHSGINRQSPNRKYGVGYPFKTSDFTTQNLVMTERTAPPASLAGGFSAGGRVFNNVLGIMVAASYSDAFRGSASDMYGGTSGADGTQHVTHRYYSSQQKRMGTHAKFDIRLNPNHQLMWYNAYMDFQNKQVRDAVDKTTQSYRMRWNHQSIFSSTMKGIHHFADKKLRFNWALAYGNAYNETPDNATIRLRVDNEHVYTDPIMSATRRWEDNSDKDKAVHANLTYEAHAGAMRFEWSAGGMYRDKVRESHFHEYSFRPTPSIQYKGTDWNRFDEIKQEVFTSATLSDPLNYDASEKITAGYAQVKTTFAHIHLIAGLRMEHTRQGYDLKFALQGIENTGFQDYYEWLPSVHARYALNQKSNLRFSYVKAINRPSFFEIVPYAKMFEDYNERGNPEIRHTVADNIDLRYEFFPSPGEQFMVGAFYKYIQDPIEYGMIAMGQEAYHMPLNFGNAHNAGIEIDATKYFRRLGIKANYTLTHSQITTLKWLLMDNPDPNADEKTIIREVSQTRMLFGQAAHVANLSLLYKDVQSGWEGQIACSYTGKRIAYISRYINQDTWEAEYFRLDASVEKFFSKIRLIVFAKASNLLNTPMFRYIHPNPADNRLEGVARKNGGLLERKEYYGQHFIIGLRYKL
ncbi:MAG: TonB-dependent receptor [Bacteroidales bacterium]|nr:TonB-dependent receptor [Bacteroidales bacterium]